MFMSQKWAVLGLFVVSVTACGGNSVWCGSLSRWNKGLYGGASHLLDLNRIQKKFRVKTCLRYHNFDMIDGTTPPGCRRRISPLREKLGKGTTVLSYGKCWSPQITHFIGHMTWSTPEMARPVNIWFVGFTQMFLQESGYLYRLWVSTYVARKNMEGIYS